MKALLWALLAAYLAVVAVLMIGAVDWGTRAVIAFIALIPLSVVSGIAGAWQLVRRRPEVPAGRRVRRAQAAVVIAVGLAAVAAFLIGYLLA